MSASRSQPMAGMTIQELQAENAELRLQLRETEETIRAIREGMVDAFIVGEGTDPQVYTLEGADRPYRLFVEEMQQGAASLFPDGTIAYCNPQLAALLKMPPQKMPGIAFSTFVHDESLPVYQELLSRVQTGSSSGEVNLRRQDEGVVPVFLTFNMLPGDSGAAMGLLVTDLTTEQYHTKLAAAHEALVKSEARLSMFLEQLPIGVGATDQDGKFTISNAVMRLFAPSIVPSRDPAGITHWKTADAQGQLVSPDFWPDARALRGEDVGRGMEMIYTTDEGEQIWTRVNAAPLRNHADRTIGAIIVIQDIDAVKRAELSVQASADRFRSLVSVITDVPWTSDAKGGYVTPQPAWAWFTGQTWEQYRDFGWIEAIHPDDREDIRSGWHRACESRSAYVSFLGRLWHERTGKYRHFEAQATPVFNSDGSVREWVGAYTDINTRKELENQLEQRASELARALEERKRLDEEREHLLESERAARTEAERSTRLKEEFLSTVSHELRTPLNAILGWTQLMQQSADEGTRRQGLDAIERGARGQAMLIDELLDVSRIVSGKLRLEVQILDLGRPFVEAAIETLRPAAEAKSIELKQKVSMAAGPVKGDPARLQQTIWNLLSNAIKFTPKGGTVQISVDRVDAFVEIAVSDTGAGISPEFLPYVFDRFRQEDNSTTRAHSGLGLGLAIVKHLVELHGGTVEVESEGEGKGATFRVRLPIAAPEKRDSRSATPGSGAVRLANVKVLVVDDDPSSCEIVRRILVACEAEVSTAQSADEALPLLEQFEPDVLVSDIGMPGKDGLTFIREVRRQELNSQAPRLPAVALTAFARAEDRIRVLQAGYNMHVAKPIDPRELIAVVGSLAGGGPQAGDER